MFDLLKRFFFNYIVPFIILLGSIFVFIFSIIFLFLSDINICIKIFSFSFLLIFTFWFIAFAFRCNTKIKRFICVLFFTFFFYCFSNVILCFVNYNANFLFNRAINVIKVVKNLFRENIKYKKSKKFPTKNNLLFTFCKLELSYLFNKVGDKDSIFGFDISFPDRYEFNFVFQEIFVNKDYYVNLDNDFPTIIDCGCYVGLSILFFKLLYPNSEILGFEAHPKTFQILRNNIEKSKLSNITLFNNAVYNSEGTLEFSCVNSGSSKILGKKRESNLRNNVIYVNSILLSDYINKPVDLLKMDIEGAEVEVIEELAKHNKLRFIKNIVMEFHSLSNAKRLTKILMTLDKEGFFYRISEACKDVAIIHAYQN